MIGAEWRLSIARFSKAKYAVQGCIVLVQESAAIVSPNRAVTHKAMAATSSPIHVATQISALPSTVTEGVCPTTILPNQYHLCNL